jgi:hypothetical protein
MISCTVFIILRTYLGGKNEYEDGWSATERDHGSSFHGVSIDQWMRQWRRSWRICRLKARRHLLMEQPSTGALEPPQLRLEQLLS